MNVSDLQKIQAEAIVKRQEQKIESDLRKAEEERLNKLAAYDLGKLHAEKGVGGLSPEKVSRYIEDAAKCGDSHVVFRAYELPHHIRHDWPNTSKYISDIPGDFEEEYRKGYEKVILDSLMPSGVQAAFSWDKTSAWGGVDETGRLKVWWNGHEPSYWLEEDRKHRDDWVSRWSDC